MNQIRLKQQGQTISKNPKLFNIDLHIDNSEGVRLEGERNGFDAVIIKPNDEDWGNKVLFEVRKRQLNLDCNSKK